MSLIEESTSCYFVRPMRVDDISQVTVIDREAFPTDWPPTSFKKELTNKLAHYLVIVSGEGACECPSTEAPAPILSSRVQAPPPTLADRFLRLLHLKAPQTAVEPPHETQKIAGYAGFWLMADEVHITDIAVPSTLRGLGLGELLMFSIVNSALELNAVVVTLEVRLSNTVAQKLYEKMGFENVGVRKAYYSDNDEDAIIMTTPKLRSPGYQALMERLKAEYSKKWGADRCPYP